MHTQTNVVFSCWWQHSGQSLTDFLGSIATYRVFELSVDFVDDGAHALQTGKHVFLVGASVAEDAVEHRTKAAPNGGELGEGLLENRREAEESQSVAGGRSVEDNNVILHRLYLLHDLGEAHGFVYTGDGERHVLHDGPHCAALGLRLLYHFLDARLGVDLHGGEIVETSDLGGLLAELLAKSVGKIVRRVGRNEQHRLAYLGELHGQRAGSGRLAHTTLAAYVDPAKGVLVNDGRQGRVQGFVGHRSGGEMSGASRW